MKKTVLIALMIIVIIFVLWGMNSAPIETKSTSTNEVIVAETAKENMITPADMPEQAQKDMYSTLMEYNQCMMQNRLEYHQAGAQVTNVADKTLQACEPHLDTLREILTVNGVNEGLTDTMVGKMRSRAARKLMSVVMQSMAGQAAAAANAERVETQQ